MFILFFTALNFIFPVAAQTEGRPPTIDSPIVIRECRIILQQTGSLRGSRVCRQELNCFAVNRQAGTHTIIEKTAYCPARGTPTVCPTAGEDCLADKTLSKDDILTIEFRNLMAERENGANCDCGPTSINSQRRSTR